MATKVCIFNPVTKLIDVVDGISTFSGNISDAGKPIVLNAEGTLDSTFTAISLSALAAETLAPGAFVNLYYGTIGSITGVYARLANASHLSAHPAVGFVNVNATVGQTIEVFVNGLADVSYVSGFSASDTGLPIYLSTTVPGYITKVKPTSPDSVQILGYIYQVGSTVQFPFLPSGSGSGGGDAISLQGTPISPTPPVLNQYLKYDGTDWVSASISGTFIAAVLTAAPGASGNFTLPHGLPGAPARVEILMTSSGAIWMQSPTGWDGTNLYLTASHSGITAIVYVWLTITDVAATLSAAPSLPGNFSIAHGLGTTPSRIEILMTSSGAIWTQSPTMWDGTYVYLVASDADITANIYVFA